MAGTPGAKSGRRGNGCRLTNFGSRVGMAKSALRRVAPTRARQGFRAVLKTLRSLASSAPRQDRFPLKAGGYPDKYRDAPEPPGTLPRANRAGTRGDTTTLPDRSRRKERYLTPFLFPARRVMGCSCRCRIRRSWLMDCWCCSRCRS